jgi:hypothetical protein
MKCPYCGQEIGTSIAALADDAFLLRTQCEKCGKEFLIVKGVPMTNERYSSHNPRVREFGWGRLSLLHPRLTYRRGTPHPCSLGE